MNKEELLQLKRGDRVICDIYNKERKGTIAHVFTNKKTNVPIAFVSLDGNIFGNLLTFPAEKLKKE